MYRLWSQDPSTVHASWNVYFKGIDGGASPSQAFVPPPPAGTPLNLSSSPASVAELVDTQRAVHLIRAYQVRGHENANLDPLGINVNPPVPELDPASYGFTAADMDRVIDLGSTSLVAGFLSDGKVTLRELLARLKGAYCSTVGVQYMHIRARENCNWIRAKVESAVPEPTPEERLSMLKRLTYAANFESFLAHKYNTAKRFGVEGCEGMIPGLKALIDTASELGVDDVVLGMAHRGRLNVLANVIHKPFETIFREFQGNAVDISGREEDDWSTSGDVKYHLGCSFMSEYPDGRKVNLSLVPNPSHLEAVDPVVVGKARAKSFFKGDGNSTRTLPILIHGDAAMSGQGVVYETMQFSHLQSYSTGGCIHVVCNNQIGFTTDPSSSRSSQYCSDVGMAFGAPIFHVNGDDLEAITRVFRLAAEYRQKFNSDVIVDLVGYRKHGHNELDQPLFTQPHMYQAIAGKEPPLSVYQRQLVESGRMTQQQVDEVQAAVNAEFEAAFASSKAPPPPPETSLSQRWSGYLTPNKQSAVRVTGLPVDRLAALGESLTTLPEGFTLHRQLAKVMATKRDMLQSQRVDWGTAEALAFGSLLQDGIHVRLSGQDVERGTFSHRHAVLHEQNTFEPYMPLNNIPDRATDATVCNSPLSEFGTLGFEFGYSIESPKALVLWEAQFGDFVNGAQIMIDQFISSAESKWLRQSGLVMLLPHGYDGQGAEHSSCRIERFLQQSDEDPDAVPPMKEEVRMQIQRANWQIINCTTPANYFHALRRQIERDFRKPLIVMSPKNLLRHKHCVSSLEDMGPSTQFQRILPDPSPDLVADDKMRRVVLCTGKVYYELVAAREQAGLDDVALVRLEQLSPFPFDKVAQQAKRYSNAEMVWVQEEPKNMGAWYYVQDRIMTATRVLNGREVRAGYVGRPTQASPAVGYGAVHAREQSAMLTTALSDDVDSYCHGIQPGEN